MQHLKILLVVFGLILSNNMQSQKFSYELGFNLGASSFQTDYGERGDTQSGLTGNMGFAAGATLFMDFNNGEGLWSDKTDWFRSHFKARFDISYMKADLDHFGVYADGNTEGAKFLKAMHGTSSTINIGAAMEYHFNDIFIFNDSRRQLFDPFFNLGFETVFSQPTLQSDLGDYKTDPNVLYPAYRTNAVFVEPAVTFAINFGIGTKIRAGESGDFLVETKWRYFSSDKIDGLVPVLDANKFNDWMFHVGLGYVFYLN